jgi:hypothetical protein
LIEYGPHWIHFTIFIFISENNRYFKSLHKIWNKNIHLTWEKRVECKTCHGKSEEKGQFGILGVSLYVSKGVLWSCLELSSYFNTTKNPHNDIKHRIHCRGLCFSVLMKTWIKITTHYEKLCLPKPHYLATKTQKTTHIQLLCNYPLRNIVY